MATFVELMMKAIDLNRLAPIEQEQLRQMLTQIDHAKNSVLPLFTPDGSLNLGNVRAQTLDPAVPITRGIYFSFVTNGTIPNNSETQLLFSDSRGYIKIEDACVLQDPDNPERYYRNPIIPENRTLLIFGDVGWDTDSAGYRDIYLNYYDASGFIGAWTFSATPSGANWVSHAILYADVLLDGQYLTLGVYQNSGGNLDLVSANLGFILI